MAEHSLLYSSATDDCGLTFLFVWNDVASTKLFGLGYFELEQESSLED
jgi:hypothetical protein